MATDAAVSAPSADPAERAAMRRAVELAARGLGSTSPNPVVGCVVLNSEGLSVGEGWHQRAGGPHAEIHALAEAGDDARGGTAVVTLEPCDHTGRTGPCSLALIEAGVARVVYAVADPAARRAAAPPSRRSRRRRRAGAARRRGRGRQRRLAHRDAAATPVRHLEVRRDARRPYRRRRRLQPLDHLRGGPRPTCTGSGPAPTPSSSAPARPAPTTRTSPCAASPERCSRCASSSTPRHGAVRPGARVLDDAAPTLIAVAEDADAAELDGDAELLRLPRAAAAARGWTWPHCWTPCTPARCGRSCWRAARRSQGRSSRPAPSTRSSATSRPYCWARARPRSADAGIATIAQALRLKVTETVRIGPDLRITAVPAARACGRPLTASAAASTASAASTEES